MNVNQENLMINATRVSELFMHCFFTDEELKVNPKPEKFVIGAGVMNTIGFHPERLEESREEVRQILTNFSDEFYSNSGGGYTFLNFCTTKDGELWTGVHRVVDQLIILGNALGYITLTPEEMNVHLPGGVPYIIIDSKVLTLSS